MVGQISSTSKEQMAACGRLGQEARAAAGPMRAHLPSHSVCLWLTSAWRCECGDQRWHCCRRARLSCVVQQRKRPPPTRQPDTRKPARRPLPAPKATCIASPAYWFPRTFGPSPTHTPCAARRHGICVARHPAAPRGPKTRPPVSERRRASPTDPATRPRCHECSWTSVAVQGGSSPS